MEGSSEHCVIGLGHRARLWLVRYLLKRREARGMFRLFVLCLSSEAEEKDPEAGHGRKKQNV